MIAARAIWGKDRLMLAASSKITDSVIIAMKRGGWRGAYVYDGYSDYTQLRELIDEGTRQQSLEALERLDTDKVSYLAGDFVNSLTNQGSDLIIDMNALSVYDYGTYEHSVNVALTATACGIGMGLSNEKLEKLAAGSLLHDCGKRAIESSIINKEGPLTPEERKKIQRHPQYGYDMLYNRSEVAPESRSCVLCHHENADGTGYPKGLVGDAIPLLARIVHVADVYDALVQKRSYKPGFSQSEAVEYLMGGCGTLFDHDVVTAFLKYIAVYPVGCDVELSTGDEARVVENHPGYVDRPTVVVKNTKEKLDMAHDHSLLSLTILQEI